MSDDDKFFVNKQKFVDMLDFFKALRLAQQKAKAEGSSKADRKNAQLMEDKADKALSFYQSHLNDLYDLPF